MSESQKPVGYGHDQKGAAGGATVGGGKPASRIRLRPTSLGEGQGTTAQTFFMDDKEIDIREGETIFRAGAPPRHQAAAPVLLAQARLPAGRQLPRLHGRDRGRARAGGKLHPHADARHEGQDPDRPRQDRAPHGRRTADHRPARPRRTRTIRTPSSGRSPSARRSRPAASPSASAIEVPPPDRSHGRWRSISTPASSAISASAPAARCRSTTSSAWPAAAITKRSCSTSTTRWATRPASPAANACRPARPAR